jgi:putative ABC transport system permease protein
MLSNYLKIALRHLKKYKTYTSINLIGLSVGLAVCITISLWVKYELSYDNYHENKANIYRVLNGTSAATQPPLVPALIADNKDLIKNAVRFWPIQSPSDLVYEDQVFVERNITFTDPSIFDVFTHPLIEGSSETALTSPTSIVISQSLARKFFREESPMGKSLNMWGTDLEITGVFEDVPQNSHHHFEALVPMTLLRTFMGNMLDNWSWNGFYSYVLLDNSTNPSKVENVLPSLYSKYMGETYNEAQLQPLADIYFNPQDKDIGVAFGNLNYVYILGTIAIFVLIIACVNFMNLATAHASLRTKEVGMRKTLGANKFQLSTQFLSEAIILSSTSLVFALILVELTLPFFSDFTGKPLESLLNYNLSTISAFIGLVLVVGVIAGSYPAFFLSKFKPINAFKGESDNGLGNSVLLRKGLVSLQFAISTFMIIAALTVFLQLRFMHDKDLGFDDDYVMVMEAKNYPLLYNEVNKLPGVESMSAAYNVPGQRFPFYPFRTDEMSPDSLPTMRTLRVNTGFIETLGIKMESGRSFDEERSTDLTNSFIINASAAKYLGWNEPIGRKMYWYDFNEDGTSFEIAKEGYVIGVVDDFNYASLHNPIEPLVIHVSQEVNSAVIRVKPGQVETTIAGVRKIWSETSGGSPFWYYFLDEELDNKYQSELKLGQVFGGLTSLALLISCLGLLGLTVFTTNQRAKEIGIRKVLGASVTNIIALLSKDFLKLVLIGFAFAIPLGWYSMNKWLTDFAYKIELGFGIFLFAGCCAVLIALITVSWQSAKAATANPVNSLKSE